ncbi:MAG: ChaN family lipoprotein [Proteobacteria bacterium]|nr:ChaN family lipoprotein [Pseudomonadota bacterium]
MKRSSAVRGALRLAVMLVCGASLLYQPADATNVTDVTKVPNATDATNAAAGHIEIGGQPATQAQLIAFLKTADVLLLGEFHDNPQHHDIRAMLLRLLSERGFQVVVEHLNAPEKMAPGSPETQLRRLEAAGFDQKGWSWPIHKPLIDTSDALGLDLWGANLGREQLRNPPPANLLEILDRAPLSRGAQTRLDEDLRVGHCGMLPEEHIGSVRSAQRLRDASMAVVAQQRAPSIVLLGNGHARKDYGVPQVLRATHPALKVISVGFIEAPLKDAATFDATWQTPRLERPDPCEELRKQFKRP